MYKGWIELLHTDNVFSWMLQSKWQNSEDLKYFKNVYNWFDQPRQRSGLASKPQNRQLLSQ